MNGKEITTRKGVKTLHLNGASARIAMMVAIIA